ncbi:MAG TPA: Do family serine endopeptidase [Treponemataceae bacterium]|nr:Do family serine endopeptidase [Treponemataceae bacterium]
MKPKTKNLILLSVIAVFTFTLFSFSCNKTTNASTNTVFADESPAVQLPQEGLAVAEALQLTFRAISDAVLPAVVEIDITETVKARSSPLDQLPFFFFGVPQEELSPKEYQQEGLGSGVIVRRDGNEVYVLTNNHVAGSADKITIKLFDGREYDGVLVGADERIDIALLKCTTKDKDIKVVKLGDSDLVQTGDICLAMGTPLGYFASVTQGIVSATGRSGSGIGSISDFIQTDAAINQGNSGGPLVNIYGEVIGINTWIASQTGGSSGLGFAIPINNVKAAIDDFISDGKISYGWMGVSLVAVTDEYLNELDAAGQKGALVSQIFLDSPAANSGIQAGDYIIKLNGKQVKDVDQLVRQVGNLKAREIAVFTVIRGGKEKEVSVKIGNRENAIVNDSSKLWPGFIAYPLTDKVRKELKIDAKDVRGIVVTNVQEKSPAAALRLQSGDIITAVNDKKINSLADFYEALDTVGNKVIYFDLYTDGHTITTSKFKL